MNKKIPKLQTIHINSLPIRMQETLILYLIGNIEERANRTYLKSFGDYESHPSESILTCLTKCKYLSSCRSVYGT